MLNQIKGLHHVTSMAANARVNNQFFTDILGLRRVKKTVNFDAPDVYHLYYGDEVGSPGSVMTYFPFPHIARGRFGTGEVGTTVFSVPKGALPFWAARLQQKGVQGIEPGMSFGAPRLSFKGPDGESFALVEVDGDTRPGWTGNGISEDHAIRGFHSVSLRLKDSGATAELLRFMGYEQQDKAGAVSRLVVPGGDAATVIDLETLPGVDHGRQGAGSVHHVAFAVENRETQLAVRKALMETGYHVTPVIDRDYFWAIYFRTPGGVLFEIATNEPGFERDEPRAELGQGLKLPQQHKHLRPILEEHLEKID